MEITLDLSSELLSILDDLAKELGTDRSGAVAELLRRYELATGYLELAETNKKEAELLLPTWTARVPEVKGNYYP
jgi:metal-responsive CopG/Arc/MetJ family transcriptional regulator